LSSTALPEKARAKINLTLRVLGRRADGYHDLESLVAFADVADTLTLQSAGQLAIALTGPFSSAVGSVQNNLVSKAYRELSALIPGLKAGRFHLDKQIPVAAGIGGGSADAAAALRLLARANDLALDDARLMTAALQVGADVPVCLSSRACVMTGVGERLSPPLALPKLPALLVNPGVALATRDVFAAFAKAGARDGPQLPGAVPLALPALIEFLKAHGNDLTDAAISCVPVIGEVLAALRALPGVQLARMSGSGATCFALFASAEEASAGAARLGAGNKTWWVAPTALN
jgi:4-diphosphocytidyl-2-C-methyl-D-erythritol kinase